MTDDVLAEVIAMLRDNPIDFTQPPESTRPAFEALFAGIPSPENVRFEEANVGGVHGIWCRPPEAPSGRAIIYLHGGGYVIGSSAAYAALAGALALETGLNVFVPEYRLAPEHPYPAGPDDVFAVYKGLADQGNTPVAVVGDSAGGGLVMTLLLQIRSAGMTQPGSAVLWSPWLNLHCDSHSYAANKAVDPTLTPEGLFACAAHYVGTQVPDDPMLRPLEADLSGLAPLLVQVGSVEVLLDDSTALATKAANAGVHTRLEVYPKMPHVFQAFGGMLSDGAKALKRSADFILAAAAGGA